MVFCHFLNIVSPNHLLLSCPSRFCKGGRGAVGSRCTQMSKRPEVSRRSWKLGHQQHPGPWGNGYQYCFIFPGASTCPNASAPAVVKVDSPRPESQESQHKLNQPRGLVLILWGSLRPLLRKSLGHGIQSGSLLPPQPQVCRFHFLNLSQTEKFFLRNPDSPE